MRVRHVTAAPNVRPDGSLIDPTAVRHGLVVGGKVAALAGLVDPRTHLNADFDAHGLEQCVVAAELAIGAAVQFDDNGLRLAWASDADYTPLGAVDTGARLVEWRAALTPRPPLPDAGEGGTGVRAQHLHVAGELRDAGVASTGVTP